MNKLIALGIAAGAVVVSGVGVATMANAVDPTPAPTPGQSQSWRPGGGFSRMAGDNPDAGMRNGGGYGAQERVEYLADALGVSEDALTAAMAKYHDTVDPATMRGRDMTDAQQAAQHEEVATFLATELKVSKAVVLEALDSQDEARRAERTAALEENLAEAVTAGRLTQAEADEILAAHESGTMVRGMGGGMGGRMGGGPRR